jgi:hypothetical protein
VVTWNDGILKSLKIRALDIPGIIGHAFSMSEFFHLRSSKKKYVAQEIIATEGEK